MTKQQPSVSWYQNQFSEFERSLNGESKLPVHATRQQGIESFAKLGFPTTKEEEWRFTNVAPIAKLEFVPVTRYASQGLSQTDITSMLLGALPAIRLVFINGQFSEEFSDLNGLPAGVTVMSLAKALAEKHPVVEQHLAQYVRYDENGFTALSTAFIRDGAFIHVAKHVEVETPVHLMYVAATDAPVAIVPRNLVVTETGSKLSIIESYGHKTAGAYLTNTVSEFVVGENSVIEHDRLQDESLEGFHISTVHFQQEANSTVVSNAINIGGSIVRNNITAVLNAEGIEATLNGLSLGRGQQLIDNHTTIDHAKPHCASHEMYKSVLTGKSKGVFNGKIFVRKDAQKTDAKQTNRTLLLSDEAVMDTKPQLEIFADDVKCTHGATIGHLDEQQMFYLRSRGIGYETAKDILTFAFASDIVNRIHIDSLREQLDGIIHERLQQGRQLQS